MDSAGRFLLGGALGAALGYYLSRKTQQSAAARIGVHAAPSSPACVQVAGCRDGG